jgi:subtilisin family serine protease
MNSRVLKLFLVVLSAVILLTFTRQSKTKSNDGLSDYVAGEILIKFADGVSTKALVPGLVAQTEKQLEGVGWTRVRLKAGVTVAEAVQRHRNLPGVVAVQPNFIYRIQATTNDPRLSDLYGMNRIQAPTAWDRTTGNPSVVVAVIDLGVDYNHEDLSANMWRNPGETGVDGSGQNKATNQIDDDGNGYVDDVHGIDTINDDSDPMDDGGHGTHVAGTIGAVGNNGRGVVGVNWAVGIMAIKSHDAAGNGTSASVIEAYQYAAMMRQRGINVRVTNSSWGGAPEAPAFDQALKDAIDLAGNASILNVCAAGNGDNNNDADPFYPASYDSPSIIAVAASDQTDNPASFSNYGANSVDIAAPGVGIVSTLRSDYGFLSGTSMAAPHVAGAAALLCAANTHLTGNHLKSLLMSNADPLPPSWMPKPIASSGRLNVLRAMQNIPTTNQIDNTDFFVRQHYSDFLGRVPDSGGLAYWTSEIDSCGNNAACVRNRRIGVSGAFFAEREFQQTGYFVYRLYKGGLGRRPTHVEFTQDRGQVVDSNLEASKQALTLAFVQRTAFIQKYAAYTTGTTFVQELIATIQQNSGVDLAGLSATLLNRYNAGSDLNQSRAFALREAIENVAVINAEFNRAFVLMQYFGYLQREADQGGYDFWLDVLNNREPNDYPAMICAFLTSVEYQVRFAPVITRTNAECSD